MIKPPKTGLETLAGRLVPPAGYAVQANAGILQVPRVYPTMPTPPNQGYQPAASLRSPLPGILEAPDQQRQIYSKGINIRRFWPIWT